MEFVRATMIDGKRVEPPATRTFPTAAAAELVTAGKAKFVDPDPEPTPTPQPAGNALPDDKIAMAQAAKKGK